MGKAGRMRYEMVRYLKDDRRSRVKGAESRDSAKLPEVAMASLTALWAG